MRYASHLVAIKATEEWIDTTHFTYPLTRQTGDSSELIMVSMATIITDGTGNVVDIEMFERERPSTIWLGGLIIIGTVFQARINQESFETYIKRLPMLRSGDIMKAWQITHFNLRDVEFMDLSRCKVLL